MAMKLYVVFGITNGETLVSRVEIPEGEYVTYMGLEMDKVVDDTLNDEMPSDRMTIIRQPFIQHGKSRIHTICYKDSDEVGEVEV